MRADFQRDREVDDEAMHELATVIKNEEQEYDEEEEAIVERVANTHGNLLEKDFRKLESPDHLVEMNAVFVPDERVAVMRASVVRASAASRSFPPPVRAKRAQRRAGACANDGRQRRTPTTAGAERAGEAGERSNDRRQQAPPLALAWGSNDLVCALAFPPTPSPSSNLHIAAL
jgi:hypothetical protein